MRILFVIFASLSFVAGASADCLSKSGVRNYSYENNVLTLEAFGDKWVADVGACTELRWADAIGFDTFSSTWVCDGDSVLTYGYRGEVTSRCHIWSLEKAQ